MTDQENKVVTSEPSKLTPEQVVSRRNILKWGLIGGLGSLTAWQVFVRRGQNRTYFTFGFNRLRDDPKWLDDRSFNTILRKLPTQMKFFAPDSLFIFQKEVCLNFCNNVENNLPKKLFMEGKLFLDNSKIIEGSVIGYDIYPSHKPQLANSPVGTVVPVILPTPNAYSIPFPSNTEPSTLNRIEWTLTTIG